MRLLAIQIAWLLIVLMTCAVLCSLVAFLLGSMADVKAVWVATSVAGPVAVFVLVFLFRHGAGLGVMIAATCIRFSMTLGIASYVAWKFSSLRTLSFFLAVTVVYLAGLFVETRLALKNYFR